eukprot:1559237-Alexandrium_andersonii.AAC.1
MKALLSLGQPAPSAGSGLVPEFYDAFSLVAGDPDTDLAPWIRAGAPHRHAPARHFARSVPACF